MTSGVSFFNLFGGTFILSALFVGLISYAYPYWLYGTLFSGRDENFDDKHGTGEDLSQINNEGMHSHDQLTQVNEFQKRTIEGSQTPALHKESEYLESRYQNKKQVPYIFNYEKALQQRMEAMKKYSYPFSLDGVDKRSNLTLQEYQDVYDGKWPVIITDVVPTWPAFNWNEEFFLKHYGESRVTMTAHSDSEKSGFALPLELFIKHLSVSNEKTWTYLQDEIFMAQHLELRAHVLDSVYTEENLFNLFPEEVRPWDCMVLWGTAHSRSTLHIDPYNWTGTNAVISGLKKWKLVPPGQDKFLSIYPDVNCGFPLECWKYNSAYDSFGEHKELLKDVKVLEVDQMPGEMLFIPTGWFHQAYNTIPTLAVSGQIMNSNNYRIVLEEIFKAEGIQRSLLPQEFDSLSPEELVKYIMARLPENVLQNGAKRTKEEMDKLKFSGHLKKDLDTGGERTKAR